MGREVVEGEKFEEELIGIVEDVVVQRKRFLIEVLVAITAAITAT
jgi:hypothetical protein